MIAWRNRCLWFAPVQATGDHQVDTDPIVRFQADYDPLTDAGEGIHFTADEFVGGRLYGPQHEWIGDAHAGNWLIEEPRFHGLEIVLQIGYFRHGGYSGVRDSLTRRESCAVGLILGSIRLPALIRILKIDPRIAAGSNLFIGFFMGALGWVGHATKGNVDYPLLVIMGATALIGSWFGAKLTGKVNLNALILTMGFVLVIVGLLLAYRGIIP